MVVHFSVPQTKWTALHYAASSGHDQTCHLLIERGADVHAKDAVSCNFFQIAEREIYQLISVMMPSLNRA